MLGNLLKNQDKVMVRKDGELTPLDHQEQRGTTTSSTDQNQLKFRRKLEFHKMQMKPN
jgi:hypothetical protein